MSPPLSPVLAEQRSRSEASSCFRVGSPSSPTLSCRGGSRKQSRFCKQEKARMAIDEVIVKTPFKYKGLTEAVEVAREAGLEPHETFEIEDMYINLTRRVNSWQNASREGRQKLAVARLEAAAKEAEEQIGAGTVPCKKLRDMLQGVLKKAEQAGVEADEPQVTRCFNLFLSLKHRTDTKARLSRILAQLDEEESAQRTDGAWRDLLVDLINIYVEAKAVLSDGLEVQVLEQADTRIKELKRREKALTLVDGLLSAGARQQDKVPAEKLHEALKKVVKDAVNVGVPTWAFANAFDQMQTLRKEAVEKRLERALIHDDVDAIVDVFEDALEVDVDLELITAAQHKLGLSEKVRPSATHEKKAKELRRGSSGSQVGQSARGVNSSSHANTGKAKKLLEDTARATGSKDSARRRVPKVKDCDPSKGEELQSEASLCCSGSVASYGSRRSYPSFANSSLRSSLQDAESELAAISADVLRMEGALAQVDASSECEPTCEEQVLEEATDAVSEAEFKPFARSLAVAVSDGDEAIMAEVFSFMEGAIEQLQCVETVSSSFPPFELESGRVRLEIQLEIDEEDVNGYVHVWHRLCRVSPKSVGR